MPELIIHFYRINTQQSNALQYDLEFAHSRVVLGTITYCKIDYLWYVNMKLLYELHRTMISLWNRKST